MPFAQRHGQKNPNECNHGTGGQVNSAGNDDYSRANAKNSKQANDVGLVGEVDGRKELMVLGGCKQAERHQQSKNAEIFFHRFKY